MYELKVEGMSCGHCISAVTRSVQEIDSGARVEVDLPLQTVRVESKAPLEQVQAAIVDAGYTVLGSAARA